MQFNTEFITIYAGCNTIQQEIHYYLSLIYCKFAIYVYLLCFNDVFVTNEYMISYHFPVGPVHLLPSIMVLFITIYYIASSCHLLQTSSMIINGCLFPFITWANLWMVTFQCFSHCYLIAKLLALAPGQ